jgi:hypothetical protein
MRFRSFLYALRGALLAAAMIGISTTPVLAWYPHPGWGGGWGGCCWRGYDGAPGAFIAGTVAGLGMAGAYGPPVVYAPPAIVYAPVPVYAARPRIVYVPQTYGW